MVDGGAAERAGFQIDDRLVSINNMNLSDLNHADVVELIKETGPVLDVKIERIPEGEPTNFDANLTVGSLDRKNNGNHYPTTSVEHELPVLSVEPRPASRQFQHQPSSLPTASFEPPLAEAESSATTPPCLSPVEKVESRPTNPDIITLVLKRDQVGSAGFSITGTGETNDPIRISDLAPNGPGKS